MNYKRGSIFMLLILALIVTACGGSDDKSQATHTPVQRQVEPTTAASPTPVGIATPAPTGTAPPPPALALAEQPYRDDAGGFALQYPEGWQWHEMGDDVIFFQDKVVLKEEFPSTPVVLVEGGALDVVSDGQLAGAQNAEEMIQALAEANREGGLDFEMGQVQTISLAGEEGAIVDVRMSDDGAPFTVRVVAVYLDDRGLLIQGGGPVKEWEPFLPTFETMVASVSLFEASSSGTASTTSAGSPAGSAPNPAWGMYTNGNFVRAIALYEGRLWAATSGGVVVWDLADGTAVKYTTLDGLPTNDTTAIVVCPIPEPRIVIGSEYGLTLYDPVSGTFEQLSSENSGMAQGGVDALDCDETSHTLFVGHSPFGLDIYDADAGTWQFYNDYHDDLATGFVSQVARIGDEVWVVASFGVSVIGADGTITTFTEEEGNIPNESAESVAVDAKGSIWLATFDGLLKYSGGEWTLYNSDNVENFPFLNAFQRVVALPNGTILAGNVFGDICQFDPVAETCAVVYENQPGMIGGLDDMIVDDEGHIYYAEDGDGISVFDGSGWKTLALDEAPLSNRYRAIASSPDGTIWLGGDFGLQQLSATDPDGGWTTVDLDGYGVEILYPTAEGMWIGNYKGGSFFDYADESWTHVPRGDADEGVEGIRDGSVTAIAVDGAGRVWFGTYRGLTVWDGQDFDFYDLLSPEETEKNRSPRQVYALLYDGKNVWAGTPGAFFRFDENDQVTRWDDELEGLTELLFAPAAYDLALDAEGNVLLALDNHLVRYDGAAFTQLAEVDSYIQSILVTTNGEIIMSTSTDGVYLYGGDELYQLTTADGLPANNFIGQTIVVDDQGTLWMASQDGGLGRLVP